MKSILESFKKIPRENKMAYLLSVGMGIGTSILVTIIPSFFSYGTEFENNIFALAISIPIPILSIILLLILSNKFPAVWKNIKTRMICVIILLIVCIYNYCFFSVITGGIFSDIYKVIFLPIIIFLFSIIWSFEYPSQSPLLITFLYSNIFIIIAAYLATKGITNLPKRIILFLIIAFLICATAATPLFVNFLST